MNKKERKNKLNEIITRIDECILDMNSSKEKETTLINKLDDVNALMQDFSLGEGVIDIEKIRTDIIAALIENTEFYEISAEITEFKTDLENYMSDLPEDKAEELEDEYSEFNVTDLLDISEIETLDQVIEKLKEAVETVKKQLENQ